MSKAPTAMPEKEVKKERDTERGAGCHTAYPQGYLQDYPETLFHLFWEGTQCDPPQTTKPLSPGPSAGPVSKEILHK